jgi:cytochrome c-type biogenesis protein CcmH/NrfG
LDSSAVAPRIMLANYHRARNRFGEAEEQLRKGMQVDPNNPEPTAALARL